jgi:hypothetical protein
MLSSGKHVHETRQTPGTENYEVAPFGRSRTPTELPKLAIK